MYRTLLATCGSARFSSLHLLYIWYIHTSVSRSHTLQATCGTLPFNENELPTHTLQATCGTLLSNENELPTHVTIFGQATCGTLLSNENAIGSEYSEVSKELSLKTQCTARCSQRVAPRVFQVYTYYIMVYRNLSFAEPHVASNVRYITFQ